MDTSTHPDPFAFANNFWGKAESGVDVLIDRVNNTAQTINNVKSFYRERAAIEDEYARKLTALSRRTLHSSAELGTLKSALDTIKTRTESLAKTHSTAASQYKTELEDPLAAFGDDIRRRRNAVETNMARLTKAKQIHEAAVDNARARYEYDCHQLKTYYEQQDFLEGKELERNNLHLERSYVAVDNSKRAYQDAIRVLAEAKERWTTQWKESCDELQDIEEERINYLKSSLWGYTNVVSTACFSDDEGCETIRVALEQCDSEKDMEKFVTENSTGTEIMNAPTFINYLADEIVEPSMNYTIAQFVRVSSSEHATNLTKSQSQYSLNQSLGRKPQSASKAFTAASGQVATILEDPSGVESGLEPATQQLVLHNTTVSVDPLKLSISSTRSADIKVPAAIPSLFPPQELENPTPETSPDPQQVMSREASLSSKSSMSYESDIGNSTNSSPQKSLFSSPPNQQIPKFDKQVVPSKEKRSWTSPFRRGKPKKDSKVLSNSNRDSFMNNGFFKPPVLKSPFATNNRENLEKSPTSYKSPFSQSRDSKIANAIASSSPEGMFDLGVPTNKDESMGNRSKLSLKAFGKDDPVLSALEKLKVSTVKSAGEHEEILSPIKTSGLSITSAGSPSIQRSNQYSDSNSSSLRTSESSFNSSTLRDSTNSRKHSTQSKELFELEIKDYQYKTVSTAELERTRTRSSAVTTSSRQRNSNESTRRGSKESIPEHERARSRASVRETEFGHPRKSSNELERARSKASFVEPETERAKSRSSIYDTPKSRTGPFESDRGTMTEPSRLRSNTYGEPARPRSNSTFGDYPPLRSSHTERADSRSSMASHYRFRNDNPYDINRSGSRNTNGEYRPRSSMADPHPPMRPISSMLIDDDRQRVLSSLDRHSSRGRYSMAADNDFGRPSTSMGSYRREVGSGDSYQNSPSHQRSRTSNYDVRTFPRRGHHAYKTSLNDIDFSAPSPTLRGAPSRSNFGASDTDEGLLHRKPSRDMRDRAHSPSIHYQRPESSRQHRYRASVDVNGGNSSYSARVGSARGNYYHGDNGSFESRQAQTLNNLRNNFPAHTRDGRPVVKYCKALFDYRPSISEEVGFRAGDVLLVVKMLEDGWWESEVLRDGAVGLAPSNFLKTIGI